MGRFADSSELREAARLAGRILRAGVRPAGTADDGHAAAQGTGAPPAQPAGEAADPSGLGGLAARAVEAAAGRFSTTRRRFRDHSDRPAS